MGVSHQIYIITNVLGRYRLVAAYYLHWLEPPEAVPVAWNLLQHVKKHAELLGKELQCLQQSRYNKNDAAHPCAFLGSLLFQCVAPGPSSLDYKFPISNQSGFTVIDVTNPSSPAYCFCVKHWDCGFKPGHPIDPEGYALRYFPDNPGYEREWENLEDEEQDAILEIQSEPFISNHQILDEAWENWSPTLDDIDEEIPSEDAKEFTKALRTVIEAGSTENAQQMADALSSTSGVVEGLRRTLYREKLSKCCDPVIVKGFIIAQHRSNSNELDLSWMQLSPAQVLKVVRAVLQNDSFKISSLDISGNSDVTIGTLSEIFRLREASELKRVFVFGCPKVEGFRRAEIRDRIGAGKETEVFNSYFPEDIDELRPWKAKPHSGKPRPRV